MRPFSQAFALFRRERDLWKTALAPLLWAALAYGLVVLGAAGLGARLGERFAGAMGGALGAATGLVLTLVLGGSIYLALVALISGFGFDRLSAEVESRAFGCSIKVTTGLAAGLFEGFARALLAALGGLIALCLGWTVVGPWLVASLLAFLDATAPALRRRGFGLGSQFGVARRLPGALPFALISGAVLLVPVVNVLVLPILVAAGTILVAEGDASTKEVSVPVTPASSRSAGYPLPLE